MAPDPDIHHSQQLDIEIIMVNPAWQHILTEIKPMITRLAEAALLAIGANQYLQHTELAVTLTDDQEIQQLNQQFRGKNKPTNVLSFPLEEIKPGDFSHIPEYDGHTMLGDIVFSWSTIAKEAHEQDKTFHDHFCHLFVHGFLHLFGYDHEDEEEATKMEEIEIAILDKFGIKCPYG